MYALIAILLAASLFLEAYAKDKNLPAVERQASLMGSALIVTCVVRIVLDVTGVL